MTAQIRDREARAAYARWYRAEHPGMAAEYRRAAKQRLKAIRKAETGGLDADEVGALDEEITRRLRSKTLEAFETRGGER